MAEKGDTYHRDGSRQSLDNNTSSRGMDHQTRRSAFRALVQDFSPFWYVCGARLARKTLHSWSDEFLLTLRHSGSHGA